ncbi:hypothetical protein M7I_0807 [Glarea lozoyensis 74030]|uniref:Uncharacterized protein n=1 Tax=Glarea lozoyensis (strain ATCC 74030 / MF5533) TaxID=1104152 RepID=H0EED2_GLAL7|nr:hypothetical protein M7I_0807 [Glarea lozoyensis 74030]
MTLPSLPSFHSATQALSHCFQNEPYAIIGSTSILLLGSTTVHDDDIDILHAAYRDRITHAAVSVSRKVRCEHACDLGERRESVGAGEVAVWEV